jgi:hypothetical protein
MSRLSKTFLLKASPAAYFLVWISERSSYEQYLQKEVTLVSIREKSQWVEDKIPQCDPRDPYNQDTLQIRSQVQVVPFLYLSSTYNNRYLTV